MISYLKGKITAIKGAYLVLETNSIGYQVRTANPFSFELGAEMQLYTYLHIREDVLELYGFKTLEERDLFLQLLSVKGIGPKGALAIIASGTIDKVYQAINSADSKYLQRFPGIGPKASQQIILDLRGKLNFNVENDEDPKMKSAIEALKSLGYKDQEIKAIKPLLDANLDKPINELLKTVLKKLY
ncbi:MAG: Holliday junction branch migration protein RuvA [Acholeplasmataceae bacterium]|nr:Holliday junction branch migration protein RuvA [Acholeplasmataceae bacterium]